MCPHCGEPDPMTDKYYCPSPPESEASRIAAREDSKMWQFFSVAYVCCIIGGCVWAYINSNRFLGPDDGPGVRVLFAIVGGIIGGGVFGFIPAALITFPLRLFGVFKN